MEFDYVDPTLITTWQTIKYLKTEGPKTSVVTVDAHILGYMNLETLKSRRLSLVSFDLWLSFTVQLCLFLCFCFAFWHYWGSSHVCGFLPRQRAQNDTGHGRHYLQRWLASGVWPLSFSAQKGPAERESSRKTQLARPRGFGVLLAQQRSLVLLNSAGFPSRSQNRLLKCRRFLRYEGVRSLRRLIMAIGPELLSCI